MSILKDGSNKNYKLGHLRRRVEPVRGLEWVLGNYDVLDDVELPLCASFLREMLRLKPSDRATAAQLAQQQWLK
jgi:serine/threonine-protein kinase SRPK3